MAQIPAIEPGSTGPHRPEGRAGSIRAGSSGFRITPLAAVLQIYADICRTVGSGSAFCLRGIVRPGATLQFPPQAGKLLLRGEPRRPFRCCPRLQFVLPDLRRMLSRLGFALSRLRRQPPFQLLAGLGLGGSSQLRLLPPLRQLLAQQRQLLAGPGVDQAEPAPRATRP
jgi:hypothetical protein